MFALHRLGPDLARVTLPRPGLALPFGQPRASYVVLGDPPCVIGAPHPLTHAAFRIALAELGLEPSQIRRVVALDWSPDQIAGAGLFTEADLFALSPDMVQPGEYGPFVRGRRRALVQIADALFEEASCAEALERAPFDAALEGYFGPAPEVLDFIPLRGDHRLRLAHLELAVIEASGPCPGHMALFERGQGLLFSNRLTVDRSFGAPEIEDARALLMSLERVFDLGARVLLPSLGRIDPEATYCVRVAHRNLTGVLSNLPYALQGPMTIPEVIFRDMGYVPRHLGRYVETFERTRAIFEELMRTGVVLREGAGVWARYGTEAPDARVSRG